MASSLALQMYIFSVLLNFDKGKLTSQEKNQRLVEFCYEFQHMILKQDRDVEFNLIFPGISRVYYHEAFRNSIDRMIIFFRK